MGFKEIQDLDAGVTTALGGHNKATGKANPTKAEGYYLGSRDVPSKKANSGFCKLHVLQTQNGNLGVWGKTDLDRKMSSVPTGAMIRITQNGKVPTGKGNDMYKFKVEVDTDNTIEVNLPNNEGSTQSFGDDEESDTDLFEEDRAADEITPTRATAPKTPTPSVDSARAAKVQALLNGSRGKSAS